MNTVSDTHLDNLMNKLLLLIKTTEIDDEKLSKYVNILCIFFHKNGLRCSAYLTDTVLLLMNKLNMYTQKSVYVSTWNECNFMESVLNTFDAMIIKCSTKMNIYKYELIDIILKFGISYNDVPSVDDNVGTDNDIVNDIDKFDDSGIDDWLDEEWCDEEELYDITDEDTAWKVRLAAVNTLTSLLKVYKSNIQHSYVFTVFESLLNRKETDIYVKMQSFSAIKETVIMVTSMDKQMQLLISGYIDKRMPHELLNVCMLYFDDRYESISQGLSIKVRQICGNRNVYPVNGKVMNEILSIFRDLAQISDEKRYKRYFNELVNTILKDW
eukprot:423529_1